MPERTSNVDKEGSTDTEKSVAEKDAGTATGAPTTPPQHDEPGPAETAAPAPPKPRGRPPLHGRYSLVERRLDANKRWATIRRKVEAEGRRILREWRLERNSLAAVIVRQIVRAEVRIQRLEAHHANRGMFTQSGELKGSAREEASLASGLLDRARRLLEHLREFADQSSFAPGTRFVCSFFEGGDVPNVGGGRPAGPVLSATEPERPEDIVRRETGVCLRPPDSAAPDADSASADGADLGPDVAVDEVDVPVPAAFGATAAGLAGASGVNAPPVKPGLPPKDGGAPAGRGDSAPSRAEKYGWQRWPEW